jgi:hypothetical protein
VASSVSTASVTGPGRAGVPVGAHWSALVGVLLLGQLLALSVLPMQAPGRPGDRVLAADTPLDRLFQQLSAGRDITVVVTDHRVVGIITAADLTGPSDSPPCTTHQAARGWTLVK